MTNSVNSNSIIVIGGGFSGLAVGCYLQMNGYSVSIYEKNHDLGGVAASWKRGKYTFDGATNWLAGSGVSSNMHELLCELFDFSQLKIVDPEEFIVVEHAGTTLHVYCDADRLQAELFRIAPEDKAYIDNFIDAIKNVSSFKLPFKKPVELYSIFDYLYFIATQVPFIRFFSRWKKITLGDFARGFTNQTLRMLFLKIFPRHEHFSVFSLLVTLGWMHCKSGGYPVGGSDTLIKQLEHKFRSLGGTITANCAVKSISINNQYVNGIICKGDTFTAASKVVSTIDAISTFNDLLNAPESLQTTIEALRPLPVFPSLIQVSLGLKRTFPGVPHKINMPLIEPIDLHDGGHLEEVMVRICSFDPTLAPDQSTSVIVHIRTPDVNFWNMLRKENFDTYKKTKEIVADRVIETLEQRFGNIKSTIEEVDIATPATFIRYTNIYKGSYQGWAPTPSLIGKPFPQKYSSIKNFYITGQWVWPAGGIPGVIRIARHTAQIICHDDRKVFSVRKY